MNIEIKQGMITSSDHFLIVTKISTRPIIKEFKTVLVFRKANWSRFKEKTKEEIIATNNMVNLTEDRRNKIDEAIEKWMLSIFNGVKASIPERKIIYHPHPKDSDFLKLLEQMYVNLRENQYQTNIREYRHRIQWIQQQIIEENIKINNEYWQIKDSIIELNIQRPSHFLEKKLKKMQGNKSKRDTPYLIDIENNNNKLYKDEEKHSLYNRTWKNVFRISEEENQNFDEENEIRVNNFLN